MSSHANGSQKPEQETKGQVSTSTTTIIPVRRYALSLAVLWTLVIGVLLWMNVNATKEAALNAARTEARGLFNLSLIHI